MKHQNLPFMWSLLVTLLLFIGPMLLYWYFSLKGVSPNQNDWLGNHGPWRFAWPYNFIYWSWVALLAMLSVLSMVFAYIQLIEILWTVN
jgi:hypothetical protein